MKTDAARMPRVRQIAVTWVALAAIGLAGCAGAGSAVDRARAEVTAKESAVAQAEAELTAASAAFCQTSEEYIVALDRYGDVLNDTAPTVGDVREAGADLIEPREDAFDGAEDAVEAQQELAAAQQELAEARAALAELEAGPSGAPAEPAAEPPTTTPLASPAAVERVKLAESEFAAAQDAVTDQTPLADASELFNSAAVALEFSWLRLLIDAGCVTDEQKTQADAAVSAYTTALQQNLAAAGYYDGEIDGIYGPKTVGAVEDLQRASELPVTGTVDRATAAALQAELVALGGAAAQESVASTAALQQTLKLVGFWDGPVDGMWTPALTEALQAFQAELGVEPTGTVDAATITAFEKAISALLNPEPEASPSATPSGEPEEPEEQ